MKLDKGNEDNFIVCIDLLIENLIILTILIMSIENPITLKPKLVIL